MRRAYLHGLSSTLGRHSNGPAKLAGGAPAGGLPAGRNRIASIGRLWLVAACQLWSWGGAKADVRLGSQSSRGCVIVDVGENKLWQPQRQR